MEKIRFLTEKLYLVTLFGWVIYFSLFITTYFRQIPAVASLFQPICYLTIFILLLKELLELPETVNALRYRPLKLIFLILFALFMILRGPKRDGLVEINVLLLVFSARNIDYRKLLGTFSLATFSVLLMTILASQRGIITNMIMRGDAGYRYSLGFSYVSFASQRLFFAICAYLMFRGKKIRLLELAVLAFFTVYMYIQTGTTSPFYLSLLILAYALISEKIVKKDIVIGNILTSKMAKYAFVIGVAIIIYFCFFSSGELYYLVDRLTHNRLRLSVEGFRKFGVSLFGQKISFKTFDIFGNFLGDYNFIDSSYVQSLVIDGLLFTVFMFFALTRTMTYYIKQRDDIVVACIAIIAIHGMFDPQMLILYYSPLILLMGKLFNTRNLSS